jgi:hypothetical protein
VVDGALQLDDVVGAFVAGLERHPDQLREPQDRAQHVVEVMRDPADELAERLQLLCLMQALLEPLALRDVEQKPLREERRAVVREDARRFVVDPHGAPVRVEEPVLRAERLARAARPGELRLDALPVVRVDDATVEGVVGAEPALDRVAEKVLHLRADVERRGLRGDAVDVGDEGKLLDEAAVADLRRLQLGLDRERRRDVADEAGEKRLLVLDAGDRELDLQRRAVLAHRGQAHALTEKPRLAGREVAAEAVDVGLTELGRDDQLGERLPQRLLARVAEHLLGGGVELDDCAVLVHADDGVEGDVEERTTERFAKGRVHVCHSSVESRDSLSRRRHEATAHAGSSSSRGRPGGLTGTYVLV